MFTYDYPLLAFAFTAVIGLILASRVLRGKIVPWAYSLSHALLGATGLCLLLALVLTQVNVPNIVFVALGVLLVAAAGGFFLATFHLRGKIPPKAFVFAHASLAVIGFVILAVQVFAK